MNCFHLFRVLAYILADCYCSREIRACVSSRIPWLLVAIRLQFELDPINVDIVLRPEFLFHFLIASTIFDIEFHSLKHIWNSEFVDNI